ncbi:MAG: RNA polymerase sigma factor [Thermoanaerobaculia bacterium]|nr:RNA polymerase sigma factor [Thermoanaerobaculia bacterium]
MEPSDDELVAAARGGDGEAFDLLMRRYERLVYRVASGFVPGREAALDLTQGAFLKAFRSLDGFRGEASFKTWLLRIAYHEGINESKRTARHAARDGALDEAAEAPVPAEQEERLLAGERRGALARALGALHHRYRAAVLLRYREGLSIRDIAAALDCSETMTKNLLFRGVRQLRRALVEAL